LKKPTCPTSSGLPHRLLVLNPVSACGLHYLGYLRVLIFDKLFLTAIFNEFYNAFMEFTGDLENTNGIEDWKDEMFDTAAENSLIPPTPWNYSCTCSSGLTVRNCNFPYQA
jgi:hypothetical protein